MIVRIKLEGRKEMQAALREMSDDVRQAASRAVIGTAVEMRGDVIKSIQHGPASGRAYRKYNPNRVHRASAPGQAPMTDTGRLASSITFDQRGDLTAVVGSAIVYAVYLEYGTSQMAARPFFRPAVEAVRAKFERRLEAAIGGAVA
jgi:HK97 gp10 family phage protein